MHTAESDSALCIKRLSFLKHLVFLTLWCDAHRGVWLGIVHHKAEFFETFSFLDSVVWCTSRMQWGLDGFETWEKIGVKISWHTPFKFSVSNLVIPTQFLAWTDKKKTVYSQYTLSINFVIQILMVESILTFSSWTMGIIVTLSKKKYWTSFYPNLYRIIIKSKFKKWYDPTASLRII